MAGGVSPSGSRRTAHKQLLGRVRVWITTSYHHFTNKHFRAFYQRLLARHKPKKLALTAGMHKCSRSSTP